MQRSTSTTLHDRSVDTAAGPFAVMTRPGESRPILAVHGVSSTNRLWAWLCDAAPWATLLAPDLPGHGGTPARTARPSSVAHHADDLVALLDALDLEAVDVTGMSLGGFVAVELAARHPDRVRSLTLIDGGLPVPSALPPAVVDEQMRARYGDPTVWPDLASYVRRGSAMMPLLDATDPRLAAALARDLRDGAAGGPVRHDLDTMVEDGVSVLGSDGPAAALAAVSAPTRLLHAEWSAGAGSAPMYPAEHVAAVAARTPALVHTELVEGVDHAAIIMTDRGAARCAATLAAATLDHDVRS